MALTERTDAQEASEPTHVDEFINYGSMGEPVENEDYARWVLNHFRLSAICKNDFHKFMESHLLFCNYKGGRYRVIGASRLGDVWLTNDFSREYGYQHRVMVDSCSCWGKAA